MVANGARRSPLVSRARLTYGDQELSSSRWRQLGEPLELQALCCAGEATNELQALGDGGTGGTGGGGLRTFFGELVRCGVVLELRVLEVWEDLVVGLGAWCFGWCFQP